ncbi:Ceg14 family Dot/Icm T4SS effector [Legionella maioricensis]|uniref:Type IV secretion protein Dot n=1 Tax=Legionella maioricensis TaxID=2896528 RepID=A0A9X2IDP7_9GAMM|nr:Ceg14 family Dot/Icm T4SS effector [Legionella maioricensis]MCL9684998.1 type IV secretion protein Dot [Legionella maioricensis]MCL9688105.1 type IV secretion protein Dot [Legionella maioricensis]
MIKKNCKLQYTPVSEDKKKAFLEDFLSSFQALKSSVEQQESENKKRFFEDVKKNKANANKESLITHETVKKVKKLATEITAQSSFDQSAWELIFAINQLAKSIRSCDLPSDCEDDSLLVKLTQNFADKTLNDNDKSWLQKILEIALYTKKTGFGNCQEKAFFAFSVLLLESKKIFSPISSLRLATFNNHFIVIVNEQFVMDPWLNIAFPLDSKAPNKNIDIVFDEFGKLVDYFSINEQGYCYTHKVTVGRTSQSDQCSESDKYSDKEMINCIQMLQKNREYFDLSGKEKNKRKIKTLENTTKEEVIKYSEKMEWTVGNSTPNDITDSEDEHHEPVAPTPAKRKKVEEEIEEDLEGGVEEETTVSASSIEQKPLVTSYNFFSVPFVFSQTGSHGIESKEHQFI